MKAAAYVLIGVISSAITAWVFIGGTLVGPSRSPTPPTFHLSYSDFVSLLLTVLAIVLTALALVIGIVAFRTIGEIKKEAQIIAQEHSKSEVERSLEHVPTRVSEAVEAEVRQRLPGAIDRAVEEAGRAGRLDEALQKAIMQFSTGGGITNLELQPEFETAAPKEDNNAE